MINRENQSAFPIIETNRLVLRQLSNDDAAILFNYWSDPGVTEYLTLEPFKTVEEAVGMIELLNGLQANNEGIRWAITSKADGNVLGTCGFHNLKPEHHRAEMGYELGQAFWKQGIMTEALNAILSYGFAKENYNRVEAFVSIGNDRSAGILKKLGFKLDGILRQYEFARGNFVDLYCYSLLKSEFVRTNTD